MKHLKVVLLTLVILLSSFTITYADFEVSKPWKNLGLNDESLLFLKEYNIHPTDLCDYVELQNNLLNLDSNFKFRSINEELSSLKLQAKANDFTSEQVNEYIKGLLSGTTEVVGISEKAITGDRYEARAVNRPNDDGIGYEVKSENGYRQTTAFAKIPSAYRGDSNDTSAYMFWTLQDKIDIGIWYGHGHHGTGWRVFWNKEGSPMGSVSIPESGLYAGREVYFNVEILNREYARIKIFNASNFSDVVCDYSIYIGGLGISKEYNSFNRQITLCREGAVFSGGAYIRDARFWDAYIYSSSGYSKTLSSNCVSNHVGSFGTNNSNKRKVKVDSNFTKKWYAEKISIDF